MVFYEIARRQDSDHWRHLGLEFGDVWLDMQNNWPITKNDLTQINMERMIWY